jgi:hypothetical protein
VFGTLAKAWSLRKGAIQSTMFTRKYWIRGRWLIFFAALAIVFETVILINSRANEPIVARHSDVLEKQVSELPHPPGVQKIEHLVARRDAYAFVIEVFTATLSFGTLWDFYGAEFSKLGYSLIKMNIRNTPDSDAVVASLSYCKNDYTAILSYKGLTRTGRQKADKEI